MVGGKKSDFWQIACQYFHTYSASDIKFTQFPSPKKSWASIEISDRFLKIKQCSALLHTSSPRMKILGSEVSRQFCWFMRQDSKQFAFQQLYWLCRAGSNKTDSFVPVQQASMNQKIHKTQAAARSHFFFLFKNCTLRSRFTTACAYT